MGKLKRLTIGLAVALVTLALGIGIVAYLKQRARATRGAQTSHASNEQRVQGELVTDERFFSRAVTVPTGEVSDQQRIKFALELESAIAEAKTGMKDIQIRAEAPDKDVIALYALGVTRQNCLSLAQSNVIQRSTESGFRTFSCQDKVVNYLFSTPIKDPRGEIRIAP